MNMVIGSSDEDTMNEGITLALEMAEDALAQQEYINSCCKQSKNIRTNVAQAIPKQEGRIEEFCNVLLNVKNVREREVVRRAREESKAKATKATKEGSTQTMACTIPARTVTPKKVTKETCTQTEVVVPIPVRTLIPVKVSVAM